MRGNSDVVERPSLKENIQVLLVQNLEKVRKSIMEVMCIMEVSASGVILERKFGKVSDLTALGVVAAGKLISRCGPPQTPLTQGAPAVRRNTERHNNYGEL
ncbi:hypothetical protein EVAR_84947_1 [Eumeta japonica]|uniref:Uncharacterized protein n=1 Tax=Eumeta variegata TaxID=151549 RepID=A0A4C1VH79_EUMVA|nr:hypothetical protein EVAR_84947_1 [Eumeta japonica]